MSLMRISCKIEYRLHRKSNVKSNRKSNVKFCVTIFTVRFAKKLIHMTQGGNEMIYTPLTNKAMRIAYKAHEGQYDTNGIPYIFHPYHVAEQMKDEVTTCVALLHDVVEDTSVTMRDLEQEFPKEVTEAVRLMTHDESESYEDYVKKLKSNEIAKAVKLGDLAHNMDETRLVGNEKITEEQLARWRAKYKMAMKILNEK